MLPCLCFCFIVTLYQGYQGFFPSYFPLSPSCWRRGPTEWLGGHLASAPLQGIVLSLHALTQMHYLIQPVCHQDLFTCEKHPDLSMFKLSFVTEASVKTSQLVVKLINSQEYGNILSCHVCENCWIQVWWDDYQSGMSKLISIFSAEIIKGEKATPKVQAWLQDLFSTDPAVLPLSWAGKQQERRQKVWRGCLSCLKQPVSTADSDLHFAYRNKFSNDNICYSNQDTTGWVRGSQNWT